MADEQQEKPEGGEQQQRRDNPFRRRNFKKNFPRKPRTESSEFPSLDKMDELPAAIFGQELHQKQQQKPQRQHQHRVYISVIIPLLDEEGSLRDLHEQLKITLSKFGGNYELIFVDDGSTDSSFKVIRELKQRNNRVKAIRFRRNYGKSAALAVGFQKAQGEFVITMDADLQDDPAEIPNLVKELRSGYDVVSGWKKKRRDPITKTIPSRFFNFVTSKVTGIKIHDFNCGLKGYKREVVKSVNVYGELHRYIPALAHWLGFRVGETAVNHRPRKYGKTKFGLMRFTRGFLDLLTVIFTTRYVRRPLHLFGGWGIVSAVIGAGIGAWLTYEKYVNEVPLSNRPLFIVALIMIIVGIQFISIGLLGELITSSKGMERDYSIREEIN
jgi:glycosyltransferase involved in cell wall biosynthesis